jgi:hypothetical protein
MYKIRPLPIMNLVALTEDTAPAMSSSHLSSTFEGRESPKLQISQTDNESNTAAGSKSTKPNTPYDREGKGDIAGEFHFTINGLTCGVPDTLERITDDVVYLANFLREVVEDGAPGCGTIRTRGPVNVFTEKDEHSTGSSMSFDITAEGIGKNPKRLVALLDFLIKRLGDRKIEMEAYRAAAVAWEKKLKEVAKV